MRWLNARELQRGYAWLRDEVLRSCGSVVLNIAEGRARGGDAAQQQKLRRTGAMLVRLAQP